MSGVSFWPVWLALLSVALFSVALWWLGVSGLFFFENRGFVYARGANGQSGNTIQLLCPVGKNISFNEAFIECTDLTSDNLQPVCDPYKNDGTLNPDTTQNVVDSLKMTCNGKNSCTVNVPGFSNGPSSKDCSKCQNSQMVANYYCV